MKPRKKKEMGTAYTYEDLYLHEFENYIKDIHANKSTKWIKKYPMIKIASHYFSDVEAKIGRKSFKQFFLDSTLEYYLRLPFNLDLMSLR
jgi:hypothetical protein